MRWSIVGLMAISFVSCKSMKGDLDVHEGIVLLKGKKAVKIAIESGKYKAVLKASSKKKFKLTIKDVEGKNYKFSFLVPSGTKFPEHNGELTIASDKSKQPYDLAVKVDTDSSSYQTSGTESCVSHYEYDTVCSWVPASTSCHTEGGNEVCRTKPSGEQVCYTTSSREVCSTTPGYRDCREVSTPVYGSQEVTYDVTTTTRNVVTELKDGDVIKAVFDHSKSKTRRNTIATGACY